MARSPLRPALWPILFFFLAGAAAAILWDLRKQATPPEEIVSVPPAPAPVPARRSRERARNAAPVRAAPKIRENARSEPGRTTAHARKTDSRFERVGIPMDSRPRLPAPSSAGIGEGRAERILKNLIESREYYGLSPECLWERPLGLRDENYEFEVVAAVCESIARGSVIGRWRVDANTGEASYRTSEGAYELAP